MIFEGFLLWAILCVLCGVYASNLNRSGIGYFVLSFLISPLITAIVLLIAGKSKPPIKSDVTVVSEFTECPFCAEQIKKKASICKHCGADVTEHNAQFANEPPAGEKEYYC